MAASKNRITISLWLFTVTAVVDIYLNGAPELLRAGLVVLAAFFLGLVTMELWECPDSDQDAANTPG